MKVTMTMKENKKLQVMQGVLSGARTVIEASEILGLSERHGYRVLANIRNKGALGVIHGNRDRASARRTPDKIRDRIIELRSGIYKQFNDHQFTDDLVDEEGIKISRETVRKILRRAGISAERVVKRRKYRCRRKPRGKFGEMLQGDGSIHDWLEGRGAELTLTHFVDDATGVEWADFFERETTEGYFWVMHDIIKRHGLPQSLYVDMHSVFRVNREDTKEEQLSGRRPLTTFRRAMEELAIHIIYAESAPAKGRVERRGGLNQDRLVSELRKANACNLEEARVVLKKHLRKNNRRFARKPANPESAFIPLPEGCDLKQILCWKEERTVGCDNTISFQGKVFQIPASSCRISWAKCKVATHLCLDGSLHIFYKRQRIACFKNAGISWDALPTAPLNTTALGLHSPNLTFSLGQ